MLDKIKRFLPAVYANDELILSIVDSFREITDEIQLRMKYEFNQLSVSTAANDGIVEWEKELAITPSDLAELDLRRAVVKAKLMRPPTVTPERFVAVVNCFTMGHDARIRETGVPFTIGLTFPSGIIGGDVGWLEMMDAVHTTKPAHLMLEIRLERKATLPIRAGIAVVQYGSKSIRTSMPNQAKTQLKVAAAIGIHGTTTLRTALTTAFASRISTGGFISQTGHITIGIRRDSLG